VPADGAERAAAVPAEVGYAVRLAIPAIKLDTPVKQAGIVLDRKVMAEMAVSDPESFKQLVAQAASALKTAGEALHSA